mgnify:CR=1 FL=1
MDAVFELTRGVQKKSIPGPFDFFSFFPTPLIPEIQQVTETVTLT